MIQKVKAEKIMFLNRFHSYMNPTIEVNRPKLALFKDKIKQITKFSYYKYIDKMVLQNNEIRDYNMYLKVVLII